MHGNVKGMILAHRYYSNSCFVEMNILKGSSNILRWDKNMFRLHSVMMINRIIHASRKYPLLITISLVVIGYLVLYKVPGDRSFRSKFEFNDASLTDQERELLEQQQCVQQSIPCPRINFQNRNKSLIDFNDFEYKLNTRPCNHDDTLLVVVHSAPNHFKERESIRTSWGHGSKWIKNVTVKVVFFVAAVEDDEVQMKLYKENHWHQDTVQGNFIDAYRNLTYKHIMTFRWATEFCSKIPYVMKMDDDIFVHFFNFVHNFIFPEPSRLNNAIECYVQAQMPVVRDQGSKWFVARHEYPATFFEDYCSGWAYLTSIDVARKLIEESKYRPYFWVDDVHVTGTLAKMARVKLIRRNPAYTTEADSLVLWSKSDNKKEWQYTFGPTWGNSELVWKGHQKALFCRRHSCECCFRLYTVVNAEDEIEIKSKSKKGSKAVIKQL